MSLMGIEDALDWLKSHGKQPKETDQPGVWRWTLPDPPGHDAHDDLPKPIFDRLGRARLYMDPPPAGTGPGPFPWLYETPVHAMLAAILAVLYAQMEGELPA